MKSKAFFFLEIFNSRNFEAFDGKLKIFKKVWKGASGKESNVLTFILNTVVKLIFTRDKLCFLSPSGLNLKPRFALATPRYARTSQYGYALFQIQAVRGQKTEFTTCQKPFTTFLKKKVNKYTLQTLIYERHFRYSEGLKIDQLPI